MQADNFIVRYVLLHGGRMLYVVSYIFLYIYTNMRKPLLYLLFIRYSSENLLSCLWLFLHSQDCLTDTSAPKGSTATSCTYFETLAMNSGRPTGTCTCHQTAVSGAVAETGGIQRDMETVCGGNVTAAEAR